MSADILIAGLREQIRYYRKIKKTGAHSSEWNLPMLSTWINGERWTDEIPSHYELKQKQNTEKCACGEKADIRDLCWGCYCKATGTEDWREKRIWDYFIKNNLAQQPNETKAVWIQRLQTRARVGLRKIG
ncbi:MAG: hypothetical protein ACC707_12740 [Thiohalomonadales bacterium]